MKIAIFNTQQYDKHILEELLKDHELKFYEERLTKDTIHLAKGFDAVCPFVNCEGNKIVMDGVKALGVKYWFQRSAGYNSIDFEAAEKNGIHVFRAYYDSEGVAEFALTLLLALNRNLHISLGKMKTRDYRLHGLQGDVVSGKTIGVLGSGKIGQTLIKLLKGFNVNIIVHDEFCKKNNPNLGKELGFEFVSLNELFSKSDFISLHAPLTPETKYIVNSSVLKLAKPNLQIINTARGDLVNTADLLDALDNKIIKGAALDVYEKEKGVYYYDHTNDIVTDSMLDRLVMHRNVIAVPHQAYFTNEAIMQVCMSMKNAVDASEKGDFSKALIKQKDGKVLNG